MKNIVRLLSSLSILVPVGASATLAGTNGLNSQLTTSKVENDLDEDIKNLNIKIAQESTVLARNDNYALPLSDGNRVNLFGLRSHYPIYGGNDDYTKIPSKYISFEQALTDNGIGVNPDLINHYDNLSSDVVTKDLHHMIEPEIDDTLMQKAISYSDTAVVVVGRDCEYSKPIKEVPEDDDRYSEYEGNIAAGDTSQKILSTEAELIKKIVAWGFSKIIIVCVSDNPIILDELDEISGPDISILLAGTPGAYGYQGIADIITGVVNPSGKTTSTWIKGYPRSNMPTYNNSSNGYGPHYQGAQTGIEGFYKYTNSPSGIETNFFNYSEGIYTDYRFYETVTEEGMIDYDKVVQYPFGYGLSYTSFEKRITNLSYTPSSGVISIDILVTNTGSVSGADVIQLYYTAPYNVGSIEKSYVNLLGANKTNVLEPGQSESITFTTNIEQLASYDNTCSITPNGGYVVEAGNYDISVCDNSHSIIDQGSFVVDSDIIYTDDNKRSSDATAAINVLDEANKIKDNLSRNASFANMGRALAAPTKFELTDQQLDWFKNYDKIDFRGEHVTDQQYGIAGDKTFKKLINNSREARSVDTSYLDSLIKQMSLQDMMDLIKSGFLTKIDSITKWQTSMVDYKDVLGIPFASMSYLGQSFDITLAMAFGNLLAKCADAKNIDSVTGISPVVRRDMMYCGANYFSADPNLNGFLMYGIIKGANNTSSKNGLIFYLDHCMFDEQSDPKATITNNATAVWVNEQAIREIYFRPFEMLIKSVNNVCLKLSDVWLGNNWIGATNLIGALDSSDSTSQGIIRQECAFTGPILTQDINDLNKGWASLDKAIYANVDGVVTNLKLTSSLDLDSPTEQTISALKRATRSAIYAYADALKNRNATWTVTFETNGGSSITPVEVKDGATVTKPADPTKAGATFDGWFADSTLQTPFDFTSTITKDTTIYAKWKSGKHTVSFDTDGGSTIPSIEVDDGGYATKPADPTKTGCTFDNWYAESTYENVFDFANTPITKDTTIYAKFNKIMLSVSFDVKGGSGRSTVQIAYGSLLPKPTEPTKDGYKFDGWYADQQCTKLYDFNTPVTSNIVLYVKWTPIGGGVNWVVPVVSSIAAVVVIGLIIFIVAKKKRNKKDKK